MGIVGGNQTDCRQCGGKGVGVGGGVRAEGGRGRGGEGVRWLSG